MAIDYCERVEFTDDELPFEIIFKEGSYVDSVDKILCLDVDGIRYWRNRRPEKMTGWVANMRLSDIERLKRVQLSPNYKKRKFIVGVG